MAIAFPRQSRAGWSQSFRGLELRVVLLLLQTSSVLRRHVGLRNLTWLRRAVSRFYSVPAVLDKPCTYRLTAPFCLRAVVLQRAVAHGVFAQDPAGTVRWQSSRLGSSTSGDGFAACCSGLVVPVGCFTVVRKDIHRHGAKRPPPTRTVCFAACAWWCVLLSGVYRLAGFRE